MGAKVLIVIVLLAAVAVIWTMSKAKAAEKTSSRFKPWHPEK